MSSCVSWCYALCTSTAELIEMQCAGKQHLKVDEKVLDDAITPSFHAGALELSESEELQQPIKREVVSSLSLNDRIYQVDTAVRDDHGKYAS